MKPTTKLFAEFFSPGFIVAETEVREVPSHDPDAVRKLLPKGAYGFHLFTVDEVELDGQVMRGDRKRVKGRWLLGAVLTLEDVKRLPGDHGTLVWNMEHNDIKQVVKTSRGQFTALGADDVVLPEVR